MWVYRTSKAKKKEILIFFFKDFCFVCWHMPSDRKRFQKHWKHNLFSIETSFRWNKVPFSSGIVVDFRYTVFGFFANQKIFPEQLRLARLARRRFRTGRLWRFNDRRWFESSFKAARTALRRLRRVALRWRAGASRSCFFIFYL